VADITFIVNNQQVRHGVLLGWVGKLFHYIKQGPHCNR
jgi:hypothetical protein